MGASSLTSWHSVGHLCKVPQLEGDVAVSEVDSFVEEVSEEVRRDRLYGYFRKYGWILIAAVLLIVGGATFNEWQKAQTRKDHQSAGDALLAALELPDIDARADALADLSFDDPQRMALVKLAEAAVLIEGDREEEAAAVLQTLADISDLSPVYGDLARLKLAMLRPDSPAATTDLDLLANPGRPYSLLALEQRALRHIRDDDTEAAMSDLTAIWEDPLSTNELRQRAQQLVLILGGELSQQPQLVPGTSDG